MLFEQSKIVDQAIEPLVCPTDGSIHTATRNDAENLFSLINKAFFQNGCRYRRKGFENRLTNVHQIHDLMEKGIFLLLTASDNEQSTILNDGSTIASCVFIAPTVYEKTSVKVNLLAVHPNMLKRGIARYMMQAVDAVAEALGYTHVLLSVISLNTYLIEMYSKLGFHRVETRSLTDEGIDASTFALSCHVIVMEKKLQ